MAVDEDFLAAPVFGAADFFVLDVLEVVLEPVLPVVFAFAFVAPDLAVVVEGFFAGVSGGETGGDCASTSVRAAAIPVSGRRKLTVYWKGQTPRPAP